MSVHVTSRVWDSALENSELLVALALSDYADKDGGSIFPSVARVAWQSSLSERTAQRAISSLRERGIIVIVRHARGARPTEYRFDFSKLPEARPFNNALNVMPNGMREQVIREGNWTCAICDVQGTVDQGPDGQPWHVDRIVPAREGGTYEWANVQLACGTCNRSKGSQNGTPKPGVPSDPQRGATDGTRTTSEPPEQNSPNGEGPKTAAPPPSDPPRNDESDFTLQEPPPPSRLFDAPDQVDQDIAEVWDYYVQINDPVRKDLTSQRKTMLKRALKEATVEECKLAIDGNRISQWHAQRSAHNLSDIFTKGRTGSLREKLDRFITDARKGGAAPSKFATLDRGYAEECKATIRKMLAFKGSDRRFGEEAIQWLKEHGIETIITEGDSEPRFIEAE